MILTSHYHNENGSLLFGAAENKFLPLFLANWKSSTQGQSDCSQPIGDTRTVPLFSSGCDSKAKVCYNEKDHTGKKSKTDQNQK